MDSGAFGAFGVFEKRNAIRECPNYDDLTPPIYGLAGSVAVVGLFTSLALFCLKFSGQRQVPDKVEEPVCV